MMNMKLLVLAILSTLCAVQADVIVLSRQNISTVGDGNDWFIKFYAPWCGHCKSMAPAWRQLANEVSDVNIAELDGDKYPDVAARFGVNGFPTMMHVSKGEVRPYEGGRTISDFKAFCDGGFREAKPLGFRESPLSLLGQAFGWAAYLGWKIKEAQDYLLSSGYPLPLVVGGGIAALFASSIAMAMLIVCCVGYFEGETPKKKAE